MKSLLNITSYLTPKPDLTWTNYYWLCIKKSDSFSSRRIGNGWDQGVRKSRWLSFRKSDNPRRSARPRICVSLVLEASACASNYSMADTFSSGANRPMEDNGTIPRCHVRKAPEIGKTVLSIWRMYWTIDCQFLLYDTADECIEGEWLWGGPYSTYTGLFNGVIRAS